ncbi:hypothetical protein H8D29_02350 [PVC group bacterium]|nr:hypothetical protein [PVC group bacterium]
MIKQFIFLSSVLVFTNTLLATDDGIDIWADAVTETEDRGTSVLIIPIVGQTLTDIRGETYEELEEEIKALNPDLIVIEINCSDAQDEFYEMMGWIDPRERGMLDSMAENLPTVAEVFHLHLKDIDQVAYVKDSTGVATILTLSWEHIYLEPTARLTGTFELARRYANIPNDDVRNKMRSAWTNIGPILGGYGNRDPALMLSLVDPERYLSGRWHGKTVQWFGGFNGDFVVDGSPQMVPRFSATLAQELRISEATVESLNDVLLLNDVREYHIVGEEITNSINDYVSNWRKAFSNAKTLWGDYRQQRDWARGAERLRWLVANKNTIKKLLGIYRNYPAVELRLGVSKKQLEQILEQIEKELRQPRAPRRGGGPSMGGGGGGMRP